MAEDYRAKKAAELIEKRRLATIAKNIEQGRTGIIKGTPLNDPKMSLSMEDLKNQGKVSNHYNTIKTTPSDTIGINPEVRNKSKFLNLDTKLTGVADSIDDLSDASKIAKEEGGFLKNLKGNKGFGKVLPALGMGAAGLAALSIGNKAMAGDFGGAGLEATDLATDYIPGVGTAKMALNPSELGNAELPEDEMEARNVYNSQVRRSKGMDPVNNPSNEMPQLAPEDRVKYEDLKRQFSGLTDRMKPR